VLEACGARRCATSREHGRNEALSTKTAVVAHNLVTSRAQVPVIAFAAELVRRLVDDAAADDILKGFSTRRD
jgi:hypothetical protein